MSNTVSTTAGEKVDIHYTDSKYEVPIDKDWYQIICNYVKVYPNDADLGGEIRKLIKL